MFWLKNKKIIFSVTHSLTKGLVYVHVAHQSAGESPKERWSFDASQINHKKACKLMSWEFFAFRSASFDKLFNRMLTVSGYTGRVQM